MAAEAAAGSVEVDDATKAFFDHVDTNAEEFIARLAECVAIDGVSADPTRRGKVIETVCQLLAVLI